MLNKLQKLREERAQGDNGFTLIELLVVVVIIGILIAIAIPLYLNYQNGAKNKSAQSDLRGAISSTEQCITDGASQPTTVALTASGSVTCGSSTGTVTLSSNNKIDITAIAATTTAPITPAHYVIAGTNTDTGKVFCYDSNAGGAIKTEPAATAFSALTTC